MYKEKMNTMSAPEMFIFPARARQRYEEIESGRMRKTGDSQKSEDLYSPFTNITA